MLEYGIEMTGGRAGRCRKRSSLHKEAYVQTESGPHITVPEREIRNG